jgi:hypothetical protein
MSAINHRTVRARRQTIQCSSRATATCHVDKRQRSYGAPDGPVPHRKGNQPIRGFTAAFCAHTFHCPVHRRTEGKNCLPNGVPTAPSCFGAIKRTPGTHGAIHQASIEHSKTPRLRKRTFRSSCLRFEHFLSRELPKLCLCAHLLTCVRGIAVILILACVSFPPLLLCFYCDQHCKGERHQLLEIPRKREKTAKEENCGTQA